MPCLPLCTDPNLSRDGVVILHSSAPGGPTTNAFTPTAPGTYLCEVTATNTAAPNGVGAPTGSVTVIGAAK